MVDLISSNPEWGGLPQSNEGEEEEEEEEETK